MKHQIWNTEFAHMILINYKSAHIMLINYKSDTDSLNFWHWQSKLLIYIIRQATDRPPTLDRQTTDTRPIFNGQRIGRMSTAISTDVSVEHRSTSLPTYRSTYRPLLDQHPSTDMSVNISTDISVERRLICWPTYQPIGRLRCRPTHRSRGS